MYKNVIEIKKTVPEAKLRELAAAAERAFHNRAGKVQNVSTAPYMLVYEGGEGEYGCLNLGMLSLSGEKDFISHVLSWEWIDEDEPDESCDVLKELSIPVRD